MQALNISIVSHGHGAMVADLLRDLDAHVVVPMRVYLTLNVPEDEPLATASLHYPVQVIRNPRPRGFGANHNAAFRMAGGGAFCVLNPDVRLMADPFPALLAELADAKVGVVAPRIVNPQGGVEPSARRFPTPLSILGKGLFGARLEYDIGKEALPVDWVSGTFMLVSVGPFGEVGGFDERYHLYYEDVDLCARLRREGYAVRLLPAVQAVHAARRDSHRKLAYLRWHLASMLRYFRTRYFATRY
jgi:GT2 family glycosyltransferase